MIIEQYKFQNHPAIMQRQYIMLQPVHLVCIDDRTNNLYVLAGSTENLEFQITPNGEVF